MSAVERRRCWVDSLNVRGIAIQRSLVLSNRSIRTRRKRLAASLTSYRWLARMVHRTGHRNGILALLICLGISRAKETGRTVHAVENVPYC